jgi:hypothetical protein
MAEFFDNHFCYLIHETEIEQLRKLHEESYRENNPTAQAVVVIDGSDAERYPAIKRLKADGYHFTDAFAFGYDGEMIGEVRIYTK